jgi:predicted nucleic-acid-binding protein
MGRGTGLVFLLLGMATGASDVGLAPLEELLEDAAWVGVVRVTGYDEATYAFEGGQRTCGFVYRVDVLETVWGSTASSAFFAMDRPPAVGATLGVVLHEWTLEERDLLRRSLAKRRQEAGTEFARCIIETGGVDHSAYPVVTFDEDAAKKHGGRWVRALRGEYWPRGDRERSAGVPDGVFSWDSVRERLVDALEGSD